MKLEGIAGKREVWVSQVRLALCRMNPMKAPAPDGIPERVLRDCANQLPEVFAPIFNLSLSTSVVCKCFKFAIIVLVPKKSAVSSLKEYRPVALTSVMKCFERLM